MVFKEIKENVKERKDFWLMRRQLESEAKKRERREYLSAYGESLKTQSKTSAKTKAKKRAYEVLHAKEISAKKKAAFRKRIAAVAARERRAYLKRVGKKAPQVKRVIEKEIMGFTGLEREPTRRLKEPVRQRKDYNPELADKWGLLPPEDSFIDFGIPKTKVRKTKDGCFVGGMWEHEA